MHVNTKALVIVMSEGGPVLTAVLIVSQMIFWNWESEECFVLIFLCL